MAKLQENLEWRSRWEERGEIVRNKLGETIPKNSVTPFFWEQFVLPGACAMTFRRHEQNCFLSMTLGLTQPVSPDDQTYPWEFSVQSSDSGEWQADLLYQLMTQWLRENRDMGFGYQLPLVFFTDPKGNLWAGLTNETEQLNLVGEIRALVLWVSDDDLQFKTSTNEFGLLSVVAMTADEKRLSDTSSPAHVLLLMRRLGVGQLCDPNRKSVLNHPKWKETWNSIEAMSHDEAFDSLTIETRLTE